MKLGLGSYAYRWAIGRQDKQPEIPLSAIGLVDKAADHGFELLQIADNMPLNNFTSEQLEELKVHAAKQNIELELGTDGLKNGNLAAYLNISKTLNIKLLRFTLNKIDLALPRHQLIKQLHSLCSAYQEANITLAIENHFLLTSKELLELIEAVNHSNLGVCLDVANSVASGEWPEQTVAELAARTVNLHLKDYRFDLDPYGVGFKAVGVPLGAGRLDIEYVFRAIESATADLNVILEHWLPYELIETGGLEAEDQWTKQSKEATEAFIVDFNQALQDRQGQFYAKNKQNIVTP